jgi:chloramphenicol-sensitive protein RarD
VYKEPLSVARLTTFAMVWTALAIFTYDAVRHFHKNRPRKTPTRPV